MKGADQCPRCASRRWGDVEQPVTKFYAGVLRVCANCATAWEPFEVSDLMDQSDQLSSFNHPCGNCAFRKGSPEQQDKEKWDSKLISMSFGNSFHCHKGVPVTPGEGHGFDYPKKHSELRICRGYLNSIVGPRLNELAREQPIEGNGAPAEKWIDPL